MQRQIINKINHNKLYSKKIINNIYKSFYKLNRNLKI